MAEITVRYFGMLHELAGKRTEKVRMDDGLSLEALVERLASKNGGKFRSFLFGPSGKLNKGIAFAADGNSINASELRRIKCGRVKEFVILPPISGGRTFRQALLQKDEMTFIQ
ncbi:MAG TPA: MoaD/ThiS family protein [Nitrososphaerales archaeon]|nr:MoaD/ThiS family protein [Nitrososphaerales archaeon]